jgi:hypothetical protein
MRFFAPSTLEVGSVHSPADRRRSVRGAAAEATASPAPKCAPSGAPGFACPVCSVLVVSHDLDGLLRPRPSRVSPGDVHGVLSFRVSPDPGGPARYRTCRPFLPFRRRRLAAGFASDRRARPPSTSRCLSEDRPSPPTSGFPSMGVRSPHGLICETSHHLPVRVRDLSGRWSRLVRAGLPARGSCSTEW